MQEPYRKGSSESILTSSLAGDIARCFLKRRPEASVGGAIELRKAGRTGCRLHSEEEEGNTAVALYASGCPVLRSRENPRTLRNNMHENREISSTPWCKGQGRSAKAINHNADMHVLEKSDHVVVPVNRRTREGNLLRRLGREGHGS
jgi:hypothetical protein